MKKYDLLKVLGIAFLILVVLSWIIVPGTISSGEFTSGETTAPLGIFDLFRLPVITFGTFFQYGIIILLIGGLYGVMNKTGVYGKLIEGVKNKFKGKEKRFLIISMIVLIVLSSLTALTWVLFILVPFLVAVLLNMKYDKVTALAATVGAILIGSIGCTYGFGINGYIINLFSIDVHYEIITKIVLLAVLSVIYIGFVIKMANKKENVKEVASEKTKKKTKKADDKKEEKTKEIIDIPLYVKGEAKDRSAWPLVIVVLFSVVLLLVGMYNFYYSFGFEGFQDFHTKITEFEVGGYAIFAKLLGTVNALGYWSNYELCSIILLATIVIALIYGVKLNDMIDGFVSGIKEMLRPALYAVLASIIFAFMITSGTGYTICDTIVNWILSISENFNAFLSTIAAGIGSLFYNDFYYLIYSVTGYYQATGVDANNLSVLGIIYQVIYGLFMLFLPTSILLIAGLSYLKVSYKEWMKYIWKLLLALLVVIIIVIVVVAIFA